VERRRCSFGLPHTACRLARRRAATARPAASRGAAARGQAAARARWQPGPAERDHARRSPADACIMPDKFPCNFNNLLQLLDSNTRGASSPRRLTTQVRETWSRELTRVPLQRPRLGQRAGQVPSPPATWMRLSPRHSSRRRRPAASTSWRSWQASYRPAGWLVRVWSPSMRRSVSAARRSRGSPAAIFDTGSPGLSARRVGGPGEDDEKDARSHRLSQRWPRRARPRLGQLRGT
jgi:hypothetical protein